MPCDILTMRQSGSRLFGKTNATNQYGHWNVASTAILQGDFVCSDEAGGRLPPPSLPLPSPGAKQPRAAAGAGGQSRFHGQLAPPLDSSSPIPLLRPGPAHQPPGCRSLAAMAGTTPHPWAKVNPKLCFHVGYTSVQIVMSQRSWPRSTGYWRPWRRPKSGRRRELFMNKTAAIYARVCSKQQKEQNTIAS